MDYHAKKEMVADQFLLGMGNHELSVHVDVHGHRLVEGISPSHHNLAARQGVVHMQAGLAL